MCVRETNIKPGTPAPSHGLNQALALHRAAPKWVEARVVRNGESVLYVHHTYLDSFLRLCRDSMLFQIKVLIDLCCIDYPFREQRFTLVYMMCSVHYIARRQPFSYPPKCGVASVSPSLRAPPSGGGDVLGT